MHERFVGAKSITKFEPASLFNIGNWYKGEGKRGWWRREKKDETKGKLKEDLKFALLESKFKYLKLNFFFTFKAILRKYLKL